MIPQVLVLLVGAHAYAYTPTKNAKVIDLPGSRHIAETADIVGAIDENNGTRLRMFFDRGYSPVSVIKNKLKETFLDRAASHGSDRAFIVILNEMKLQGLKPRLTDSRGTPLIVVLSSLAVVGQKMTDRYERMATALVQTYPETLKLIDRAYIGDGRTALHQAAASGNVRLIRTFISNGANVNAKNTSGETPLHLASRFGHVDAVRYLISAGARVDEKTRYTHATPLMAAAEMGHETVIRVLMSAGAHKEEKDFFGKSAPERYKEYATNFYARIGNASRSKTPKQKNNRRVSTTSTPVPRPGAHQILQYK
ncbi:MAG: ankyrin repeat domain-containing protein [Bdellovibrionales bacterium]|nr:ankyrin repeat domain-containing protein [Bdellovibrionales bacterium]